MRKMTAEQIERIRVLFYAAGGRAEWEETLITEIRAIVEGGYRAKPKTAGAKKKSTQYLERKIEVLTRRVPRHRSDRELSNRLSEDRRRIAKARKAIKAKKRYQLMRNLGIKYPKVISPLSLYIESKK